MSDCIFCKIANGGIKSERIYENESFFSIFDAHPKVEGHALVISKRHLGTILDMPDSLAPELLNCIKKTALKLMDKYKAEGFNVGNNNFESAGQIVQHLHFHILPRKKGDGFMAFG
ncbi:MAG: HIT domain-containing protein [Nanoarchaeota archaeon]|nr:HIT domain-containing protein [Nanoarchaeota archaeon]